MSRSKKQSLAIIGIALLMIAGILLYFSLSQPRIYVPSNSSAFTENNSADAVDNLSAVSDNNTAVDNTVHFPININTCTGEELLAVSGIGESKASAIVEYREYIGGYTSVEQIKNIRGIGDSTYQSIAPYLCV
ncbi:MAG: helix-hairpin-helix domain-containing protein [Clostridium sp.]|nr:helix-hairpin-helix domain-containing protein [Clostridium sp.]